MALLGYSSSLCLVGLYLLSEQSLGSSYLLVSLSLANLAILSVLLSLPSVETLLSLLLAKCTLSHTTIEVLHEKNALIGKDVAYGGCRLCTYTYPIESTLKIENYCTRIGVRVERTNAFDNFAITWRAAVCYYDVVESVVFVTMTSQTNLCCHLDFCFAGYDCSNRLPLLINKDSNACGRNDKTI